ncbi:hypothetical protein TCDM_09786 [Trypanosoma cruzi Dm28c]|uniref:Uncharacterized protein n=2 Tax=Trypanosoma cruzi TaxID=5693 RepID=V5D526_TRYCR|nr:hypothetical protein TCDM_09786 [Trypanosoma cruzi Dm28c]PBJ70823.1 hypothetical protein BCY84_17943 [Trypanosoma cruzi cruzi]PWV00494.1 hypothetical protein C4B63_6g593 [Trypanosoma cruzi]
MDGNVTCSWREHRHDCPPPNLIFCEDAKSARMHAEAVAASRADGNTNTTAVELDDENEAAAAPWMTLQLQNPLRHLVVLSNARVLEVHVGETAIYTHKGVAAAAGLFLHDTECNAVAGQTLKLKFFARKAKHVIDLVALSLVFDSVGPDDKSGGHDGHVADAASTVESRLRQLEMLLHTSMKSVVLRLKELEARIGALESLGCDEQQR